MKKFFLILLLLAAPAWASQNATQLPTSSPYAGLTMLNNINSAFNTFQTNFSGSSAPSSPDTYQWWTDTTDSTLRFYDGTNWLPVAKWSGSQWVPISNGVVGTIPASTGSSNAYVVTYAPVPTALITGQHYPFIANFQNTGAATLNVNSLGAVAIKKQGGTALISGDIVSGAVVDVVYDGTNMQMLSQLGNSASGTVTSIATNNGITGGTITASGTIGLATISNNSVLANSSGGTAVPVGETLTSVLDAIFGSSQGSILYRSSSVWTPLTPGTNGQPLLTGGSGANPSYGNLPVGAISASGTASSSTYLRGDGSWQAPTGGFSSCTTVTGSTSSLSTATCAGGYTLTGGTGNQSGSAAACFDGCSFGTNSTTCGGASTGSCAGAAFTAYSICCH